jgi:hypothetical protein
MLAAARLRLCARVAGSKCTRRYTDMNRLGLPRAGLAR